MTGEPGDGRQRDEARLQAAVDAAPVRGAAGRARRDKVSSISIHIYIYLIISILQKMCPNANIIFTFDTF